MSRPIQQTMAELIISAAETGKEATFTINGTTYDFDPEGLADFLATRELNSLTVLGNVIFSGLPDADPGVAGALWLNAGVLTVSTGA